MCKNDKSAQSRVSVNGCPKGRKAAPGLHARFYPRVRRFISRYIASPQDVEDLAEEILLTVSKQQPSDTQAYLLAVARHVVNQHRREKLKKRKAIARLISASLDAEGGAKNVRPVSKKQIKKLISRRDVRISAKLREALELRYIEGLSCEQAAQKIGCSIWAFYKRFERAKKALKEAIKASR